MLDSLGIARRRCSLSLPPSPSSPPHPLHNHLSVYFVSAIIIKKGFLYSKVLKTWKFILLEVAEDRETTAILCVCVLGHLMMKSVQFTDGVDNCMLKVEAIL